MDWKILESTELFTSGLFQLRSDRCQLPDGRIMPRYYVLSFPDWVNILPVLPNGDVLLVRQYRHASGLEHLEVPGGSMDPGANETPEEAARREMLEETGFDSHNIIKVGSHYPNPALQNNQMHTYIAFDSFFAQETQLDEFEDLSLYTCSLEQLKKHLQNGDINHSIMMASLSAIVPYLESKK